MVAFEEFEGATLEKAKIRSYDVRTHGWIESQIFVKIAPDSFSQGAMRRAYRMLRYEKEDSQPIVWVAKVYMRENENGVNVYEDDVILQTVAAHYGSQFNEILNPPKRVEFMEALIMEMIDRTQIYAIEPYIVGEYTKHSNNVGFVDFEHWRNTPHAFSHFTYEYSKHTELVCDIQGVNDLYTDPQLHSIDSTKYGSGNLGRKGIALFFYTHRCNPLCALFKLPQFEHFHVIETIDRSKIEESMARPDSPARLALWKGTTMTKSFDKILRGMQEKKTSQIDLRRSISKTNLANQNIGQSSQSAPAAITRAKPNEIKSSFRAMSPSLAASSDDPLADFELLNIPKSFEVIEANGEREEIGRVHRELADLHEHGRLSLLDQMMYQIDDHQKIPPNQNNNNNDIQDESNVNLPAVLFHYQKAAEYGDVISMLILARIFSGSPRDVLPSVPLELPSRCFQYLKLAAKKGNVSASYHTAMSYQHGYYQTKINWKKAVVFYEYVLATPLEKNPLDENLHNFNLDEILVYEIAGSIAQMYEEGGYDLEQDYVKAAEYYRTAAEDAMEHKKGKLSAQYYEKAELCDSM